MNKKIYAEFTKGARSHHDVVAYHISQQRLDDDEPRDSTKPPHTSIVYMDSKALRNFLFHEDKADDGVLQRFVKPKGAHNSMIQATWSPQMCLLERRVNVNPLRSSRIPLLQARGGATHSESDGARVTQGCGRARPPGPRPAPQHPHAPRVARRHTHLLAPALQHDDVAAGPTEEAML